MTFELLAAEPPEADHQVAVVEIHGEVDATNAGELRTELAARADHAIVVDLSHASYVDSAGFAALDHLLSKAPLAVVVSPGSVMRTAAQLMSLPLYDSVEDARASLR